MCVRLRLCLFHSLAAVGASTRPFVCVSRRSGSDAELEAQWGGRRSERAIRRPPAELACRGPPNDCV